MIWTVIPAVILVALAVPAAETLIRMNETRNAQLTIKVTGYQWRWQYDYIDDGVKFFSVLAEVGYTGAMNIENEDEFYYPAYDQGNFTEQFKRGFRVAHEFLKTLVPPVTA